MTAPAQRSTPFAADPIVDRLAAHLRVHRHAEH